MKIKNKNDYLKRRHLRVRNKIRGTAERPRMCVYKSNRNIYVQFVDDEAARTLASTSTQIADFKGAHHTVDTAKKLGEAAAKAAKDKGIETVVFDRGGFRYAGKIAALADAAREAGLNI